MRHPHAVAGIGHEWAHGGVPAFEVIGCAVGVDGGLVEIAFVEVKPRGDTFIGQHVKNLAAGFLQGVLVVVAGHCQKGFLATGFDVDGDEEGDHVRFLERQKDRDEATQHICLANNYLY